MKDTSKTFTIHCAAARADEDQRLPTVASQSHNVSRLGDATIVPGGQNSFPPRALCRQTRAV
jgi:hypothetical protein